MHYKKQPCRNFQRGSCQYGDRCKFLHATPSQQSNSNNNSSPFGFGAQSNQQQQQKNPFGFGVQSNNSSKPSNDFANKQSQFKPFDNKWTRNSNNGPSSQQPANQQQPSNHGCTDPDSCKRIIADDFQNERPLWNLTCYGHWRNIPCDIFGDISYEELRAVAYDEAKRGIPLQSIVERERNLLNSKLAEFENLLHNYKGPSNSAIPSQSQFPATTNAFSGPAQNGGPPPVSSFSQFGSALNSNPGVRPSPSNNVLGQPNSNPNPSQISGAFGANNFSSPNAGVFSSQAANQLFGSQATNQTFGSQVANQTFGPSFTNTGVNNSSNQFPAPALSKDNTFASFGQSQTFSSAPVLSSSAFGQTTTNNQLVEKSENVALSGNPEIWLKEKWVLGEIPDEEPPAIYCQP